MTLVRFKNHQPHRPFNNFVDHFFTDFPSLNSYGFKGNATSNPVPVNIKESEQGYTLEVVAPGWKKEDFKIDLDQQILTISAEWKNESKDKQEKQVRCEYSFRSFKRSFTLDENIDAENISAQYVNGILTLNLPRKEQVKPTVKQITIQ